MYNNKINNPIPAYLDKDNTFVQEDNRINPLVYMHVTENKSPREWLRDVKFAENAYLTPEMQITGDGAKNYQKALDKVSNFKTKVKPISQDDYQREMYFKKFNTDEVDRLIYLNNALDVAWNNKKNTFKNERQYNRAYNKYVEQKNTINNNLKNIGAAADKIISNDKWMNEFNRLGHVWNTQVFPTLIGTTMLSGYSSPWSIGSGASATSSAASIPSIALESVKKIATDPRTYVSILGGMAADEGVRLLSDGEYNGVGDWMYQTSGAKDLVKGTLFEDGTKSAFDMGNPAYYLPYGNFANATGSWIDDGLRAIQKVGFFTPSEGIPADAIGMNLPKFLRRTPLTLEKINAKAKNKNIKITDVGNPPKDELKALQEYVKTQNKRTGEPWRYIYKENGQYKYDYGWGNEKFNLDLNNLPNSNIGLWNWIKEHKWPIIGLGTILTTGIGPKLIGMGVRNIADIDDHYLAGYNRNEQPQTSEKKPQQELQEAPIEYRIIPDSLLKNW